MLELAPGLMFDNFLPIPDAESLPFYPLVLELVVCAQMDASAPMPACVAITVSTGYSEPENLKDS